MGQAQADSWAARAQQVLAVVSMWLGLVLSYAIPTLPPSTAVIAIAAAIYLLAFLLTARLPRVLAARAGTRLTADGPTASR